MPSAGGLKTIACGAGHELGPAASQGRGLACSVDPFQGRPRHYPYQHSGYSSHQQRPLGSELLGDQLISGPSINVVPPHASAHRAITRPRMTGTRPAAAWSWPWR